MGRVSSNRACSVEGCDKKHYGKNFCKKHYNQVRKHGKIFISTSHDFNEVIDKGSYYELILTNRKMEEIGKAKIDKEDLEKVKAIGRWSLDIQGYVCNQKTKSLKMHRLIMNAKDSEQVDHIKTGKKFKSDNRKNNLRLCTSSQNCCNRKLKSTNTSGYKGVVKNGRKWTARITVHQKHIYLGLFETPEKAYKAYKNAAKKYHKEFTHETT